MTKRTLTELLTDGLDTLASEARMPSDLADRALARARSPVRTKRAGVVVAAAASLVVALAVVRPAGVFDDGPERVGGCEPALVASYLTVPGDGSAPTAHVYDWKAPRCDTFKRTPYAWAVDNYERIAVLGRAGDPRGVVSNATRRLGILDRKEQTERWVQLPGPAWAALWSPDHGSRVLVSLVRDGGDGGVVFVGYVVVDPRTAEVTSTVMLDEPALTPFQWTPDSRHVVAAFHDGVKFFDLHGQVTRRLRVQGLIPFPAAVSPTGERILVQRHQDAGSGHYVVMSIAAGRVTSHVNVEGTLVGWTVSDEVLSVEHGEEATKLFAIDLAPRVRKSYPNLKVFPPRADRIIPRLDMLYEEAGPPPQSPAIDPEDRVGTTPPTSY